MDYKYIFSTLEAQSSPMSKLHHRSQRAKQNLDGKIAAIHGTNKLLKNLISERHLHRKLANGRTCFTQGSRRVDDCEICMIFDNELAPEILDVVQRFINSAKEFCPLYFSEFVGELDVRTDSVEYLERLREYVKSRPD